MRKNATKLAAAVLSLAMVMTSVSMPASAAKKKTTKINKSTATLYTNGSKSQKSTTLYVTVGGKKVKATFKSSNTKILTVAKKTGKVTAKKPGKATVTATYKKKNYKCTVTVKAYATSVKVSPTSVNLVKGKTKVIKATVSPSNASNKKVSFSSSNKAVATVSSTGKITAKKAGTAKITVTALGSKNDAKKAYVTVKVTNPAPAPTETPVVTETPAATETPVATVTPSAVATEGTITITTNVTGASVKVVSGSTVVATGSTVTGTAFTTKKLDNGTYTVTVSKEGYKDATAVVVVSGDVEAKVDLVKITAETEKVTAIDNKKVYITGKGLDGLTAKDITIAGKEAASVDLRKDGTVIATASAELTAGSSYEVKVVDKTFSIIAKPADTTALKVVSVAAKSNTLLEVKFDAEDADDLSILDKANYVFDNDLKAESITYKYEDNKKVLDTVYVTTSKQTVGKVYTATIDGVKDYSGNASKDQKKTFAGIGEDKDAPTLDVVTSVKGNKLEVTFKDASQLDAASLTNIANYTIDGLTVKKATVEKNDIEGGEIKVVLETSEQTVGKLYTLKVANVADIYGNKPSSALEKSFAGTALDKDAPNVQSAEAKTNTSVEVVFDDVLDEATATAVANYKIDGLTITSAKLNKDDKDSNVKGKKVTLTTSAQTAGKVYEVVVSNVKDEAGNVITTNQTYKYLFAGAIVDTTKPTVTVDTSAVADKNTVVLKFDDDVDAETATTATNYSIDGLGYPTSVKYDSTTNTVTLRTADQTNAKMYTITINNIKDLSGNVIEKDTKVTFTGVGNTAEALKVSGAVALNNKQVKVIFNKDVPNDIDYSKFIFDKSKTAKSAVAVDSKTYIVTINETFAKEVYTLTVVDDVTDIGLNKISTNANDQKAQFGGITTAPVAPKVKAVTQTSNKDLVVTFDQEVSVSTTDNVATLDYEDSTTDLSNGDLAIDSNDKTKVIVTFDDSTITPEKVAKLKLTTGAVKDITEENPIVATADSTTHDFKFGTVKFNLPVLKITNATAIDENTVEVTYNQSIKADDLDEDTFKINDENGNAFTDGTGTIVSAKKVDSNKVRVYFTGKLTEGKLYTITTVEGNVDDVTDLDKKANVASNISTNLVAKFGANNKENPAAKLVSVVPLGEKVVQVTFSKPVNTLGEGDFKLSVNDGTASAFSSQADVAKADENGAVWRITLKDNKGTFISGNRYKLSINSAVAVKDVDNVATIAYQDKDAKTIEVGFGGIGNGSVITGAVVSQKVELTLTSANTTKTNSDCVIAFGDNAEEAKSALASATYDSSNKISASDAGLTSSNTKRYLAVKLTDDLGSVVVKTFMLTGDNTEIKTID